MIKKILAIGSLFSFIYICLYTSIIEDLFDCSAVATGGGFTQYVLLGVIISLLIIKK